MAFWKQSLSAAIQFINIIFIMIIIPSTMSFNTFVEQQFAMEPQDQVAVVGARVILPCRVINKQGVLQWTKDDFGLGTRRKLVGFDRYQMIGSFICQFLLYSRKYAKSFRTVLACVSIQFFFLTQNILKRKFDICLTINPP